MLCVCGADCSDCPSLNKECQGGCEDIKGRVYWTKYFGTDICPVYTCVESKKFKNCGDCEQLPCETWIKLKDPSMTEEQHNESIRRRVALLRSNDGK
ncbi:MAG: DUF3795 domain-containing protein [Dehalococcoidales bacterium]|nr:DUF3795 domain-containing protein [Dehalococcoidales bacterium]